MKRLISFLLAPLFFLLPGCGAQEAEDLLARYSPLLVDAVPLTLEEIFIYELGGADYAVKDIVL